MIRKVKNIDFQKMSPTRLNRRWGQNKVRFMMDMVSTDHKFYYYSSGNMNSVELFSQLIVLIHSLPGYFMCIDTIIARENPFLNIKKGNHVFNMNNIKSIIGYISVVKKNADKYGITMEDVIATSKTLKIPDPSIGFVDFLEEVEFEKTK